MAIQVLANAILAVRLCFITCQGKISIVSLGFPGLQQSDSHSHLRRRVRHGRHPVLHLVDLIGMDNTIAYEYPGNQIAR